MDMDRQVITRIALIAARASGLPINEETTVIVTPHDSVIIPIFDADCMARHCDPREVVPDTRTEFEEERIELRRVTGVPGIAAANYAPRSNAVVIRLAEESAE